MTAGNNKLEPWIETFTGRHFEFLNPQPDQIDIRDIAHSLAYTCRYTGHSNRFYSVAEHSILVSYLAADPLAGLLHDASEAYITDIASPIKPHLDNYKELEDNIMGVIAKIYGFTYPLEPDIKDCDATQLKTEAKHLLKSGGIPWAHLYPTRRAHGIKPMCLGPEEAETTFLERFEEVKNVLISSRYDSPDKDFNRLGVTGSIHSIHCGQNVATYSGPLPNSGAKEQPSHCGEDCQSDGTGYPTIDPFFRAPT